jgi:hypothetical protein
MGRLQSKGHSKLDIDHTALNSASLSIHSHSIGHFLSNLGPNQTLDLCSPCDANKEQTLSMLLAMISPSASKRLCQWSFNGTDPSSSS